MTLSAAPFSSTYAIYPAPSRSPEPAAERELQSSSLMPSPPIRSWGDVIAARVHRQRGLTAMAIAAADPTVMLPT